MIFNWFNRKKEEKKEENSIIEIIDDNGDKKQINKNIWLEKELRPLLEKNEGNISQKCALLETALDYGLAFDVVKDCYELYHNNRDNIVCVNLMFNCYIQNKMYSEAVEIYEKFYSDGQQLTYYMYYDLALAYEKLGNDKEVQKYLLFSIDKNNNYTKSIDKFINYIKSNSDDIYFENWLRDLAQKFDSYYIYLQLSDFEYSIGNETDGTAAAVMSLNLNPNNEKHLLKIANILKNKKRYIDYENNIIPRYVVDDASIEMHISVLDFYYKDNQYKKGLDLLKSLYELDIYAEQFIKYEKLFLFMKLREENYDKYELMLHEKYSGNMKNLTIEGPIYSFKTKNKNKSGKKMLILPFTVNSNFRSSEIVNDFIKNIHLFLNEKIYLNKNMNNKAFLLYDDLGTVLIKKKYSEEYYQNIKKANPDLDMILSGEIDILDTNGVFDISIHTYDLNNNQKIERFRSKSSPETYDQVISKFLNSCLKVICDCPCDEVIIKDKRFMQFYSDYINILLKVNDFNSYRIYQTVRILKYCLEYVDENQLNTALSLIYFQSKNINGLKERYKQKIYNAMLNISNNDNIVKKFNLIYGVNEKDEN